MEIPRYLQVLWSYKWLLALGVVLAIVAGAAAGYTLKDGRLEPKGTTTYTASTTVLLTAPTQSLVTAVVPGQSIQDGTTAPQQRDLPSLAVLYAYLITGQENVAAVEAQIGELADGESLTAVRRTNQPGISEQFPGRLTLPIVETIAFATSPERAEEISAAATETFIEQVTSQQEAEGLADDERIQLDVITTSPATVSESEDALMAVAVVAVGILAAFVALAFVLDNIRRNRRPRGQGRGKRAAEPRTPEPGATSESGATSQSGSEEAPAPAPLSHAGV